MRALVDGGSVVFLTGAADEPGFVDGDDLALQGEAELAVVRAESVSEGLRVFGARAAALAELAREAGRPYEVVGSGVTARCLRTLLGPCSEESRPGVIVECTGDPANIAAATRRLRDLGTLVLAGSTAGSPFDLALYPDVHLRGLRLVGARPELTADLPDGAHLPAVGEPRRVQAGVPCPLGDPWYCVSADASSS